MTLSDRIIACQSIQELDALYQSIPMAQPLEYAELMWLIVRRTELDTPKAVEPA